MSARPLVLALALVLGLPACDASTTAPVNFVHGQEFVVRAPYAGQNRAALEGLNSGRGWGGAGNDNGQHFRSLETTIARAANAQIEVLRRENEAQRKTIERLTETIKRSSERRSRNHVLRVS